MDRFHRDKRMYHLDKTASLKSNSKMGSKMRRVPKKRGAPTKPHQKIEHTKIEEDDLNVGKDLDASKSDKSLSFEERLRNNADQYHDMRRKRKFNTAESGNSDSEIGDSDSDCRESSSDAEDSVTDAERKYEKSFKGSVGKVKMKKRGDSDEEDQDELEEDDEIEEDDEYAAVKEEISSLSFEELQQLKEKLGLKVFNRIMHGSREPSHRERKVFKRENKNRPREMSSKKPVPRYREIVSSKKKFVNRDPRFDDLSGTFNPQIFEKTYSFIGDVKDREKQMVQKKLKKEKNPEKKQELQYLLNRMKQQEMSEQQKQKKSEIEKEWKKKEKERVATEGKTPYYLKKADLRKLELAEKYKELKKSGKVDKYLSKKRKKTAQREKRLLPT